MAMFRHVGGPKQYNDFPLGNIFYSVMQKSPIVLVLQHDRRAHTLYITEPTEPLQKHRIFFKRLPVAYRLRTNMLKNAEKQYQYTLLYDNNKRKLLILDC